MILHPHPFHFHPWLTGKKDTGHMCPELEWRLSQLSSKRRERWWVCHQQQFTSSGRWCSFGAYTKGWIVYVPFIFIRRQHNTMPIVLCVDLSSDEMAMVAFFGSIWWEVKMVIQSINNQSMQQSTNEWHFPKNH